MSSIINKFYGSYSEKNVYTKNNSSKDIPKDRCVLCDEETNYYKNDSVQKRVGYVEGCGQLCNKCDLKLEYSYMERLQRYSFLY